MSRSVSRLGKGLACAAGTLFLLLPSGLTAASETGDSPAANASPGKLLSMTAAKQKPLFRDFMGLNVHTVSFKPELYKPVCRLVRDYHGIDWDIGSDTSYAPRFPMSRNGVNWETLYGSWVKAGYDIDVCLMLGRTPPDKWKNMPRDAFAYGLSFARFFGPSGTHPLANSAEIGNEPGNYPDAAYRTVFENMARGLRQGDPKLRIVTSAAVPGPSEKYAKSLSCVAGLESLYDVINLHTYAFAEQYPTWRRSYPEDPTIKYLTPVKETIAWRNAHAPGKEIWITEFGWDASTKPPPPTGDFSKWMSSTETQQAQYLVRSFLVFSNMDVDRAYIYYFNDEDEAQLHGSSGLTRNYVPKPAFYAVAHLYHTLGDYRFSRAVVQETGKLCVYEYRHATNPKERIWAVWLPTGANRQEEMTLPAPNGTVYQAERMPMKAGPTESVPWEVQKDGKIRVQVSESPLYLRLRDR
jgi:serine/threonine-protein kinase ATR